MPDHRNPQTGMRRGIAPWPLVLGAAAIILAAVLFLMSGPVKEPVPTPGSPAATGVVGVPSGVTGASPHPGAPAGADAPAGSPTVTPRP